MISKLIQWNYSIILGKIISCNTDLVHIDIAKKIRNGAR